MAMKPDGTWSPDDDNVANAVAGVVDKGGPLMKRASGMGLALANGRGMANSSMAVGAAQGQVLDRAIAIGGQEAGQRHAKNLSALESGSQLKYGTTLQQMQDESAKERLGMQIGSDKELQGGQIGAQKEIAGMQIASTEKLSGADIASREKLTGAQIASTEKLSGNELAARMQELATKIAGDRELAAQGDVAAEQRLKLQLAEQARLEAMKIQSVEGMQSQQIASTERLSSQEIGARMAELTTKIDADRVLANQGDTAAMARLEKDLASRAQLQDMQNRSAESIAAGNNTTSLGVANIGASTSLATARMQEEGATTRAEMSETGAAKRQAEQNIANLTMQREKIAADTSISDADRAARLAEVDKNIASNQAITQMQEAGANTRQESSQTAALQLQREKIVSDQTISSADRAARLAEVDKNIASAQDIARLQDTGATSRAQLAETGATARQGMGDEAALDRQRAADVGALERQREEIVARKDISEGDRASRLAELDKQIAGNKDIASLEGFNAIERQKLANSGAMDQQRLDSTTKLTLGEMESSTSRANTAVQATTSASNSYNETLGQLMQNDKIPAAARDAFMQSAKAATEATIGVIEDIAGLNLGWGANGKTVPVPNGGTPQITTSIQQGYPDEVQLPNGLWYRPSNGYIDANGNPV